MSVSNIFSDFENDSSNNNNNNSELQKLIFKILDHCNSHHSDDDSKVFDDLMILDTFIENRFNNSNISSIPESNIIINILQYIYDYQKLLILKYPILSELINTVNAEDYFDINDTRLINNDIIFPYEVLLLVSSTQIYESYKKFINFVDVIINLVNDQIQKFENNFICVTVDALDYYKILVKFQNYHIVHLIIKNLQLHKYLLFFKCKFLDNEIINFLLLVNNYSVRMFKNIYSHTKLLKYLNNYCVTHLNRLRNANVSNKKIKKFEFLMLSEYMVNLKFICELIDNNFNNISPASVINYYNYDGSNIYIDNYNYISSTYPEMELMLINHINPDNEKLIKFYIDRQRFLSRINAKYYAIFKLCLNSTNLMDYQSFILKIINIIFNVTTTFFNLNYLQIELDSYGNFINYDETIKKIRNNCCSYSNLNNNSSSSGNNDNDQNQNQNQDQESLNVPTKIVTTVSKLYAISFGQKSSGPGVNVDLIKKLLRYILSNIIDKTGKIQIDKPGVAQEFYDYGLFHSFSLGNALVNVIPNYFYKFIFSKPIDLSDIFTEDDVFIKSLNSLKFMTNEEIIDLDLTMSVPIKIIDNNVLFFDLINNGHNISVDSSNVNHYIDLITDYYTFKIPCNTPRYLNLCAFKYGFNTIYNKENILTEYLMDTEIITDAFMKINKYPDIKFEDLDSILASGNNEIKDMLLKYFKDRDESTFKKFLKFSTGSDYLDVDQKITVYGSVRSNIYPTATTCSRAITIPIQSTENYEIFSQKLDYVLDYITGFQNE